MKKTFRIFVVAVVFLLTPSIHALAKEMGGGPAVEKKYQDILTNFYKNPEPQKIPAALEHYAASNFPKTQPPEVLGAVAYIFARIAQQEPALVPKYREVFVKTSHPGRLFVLMVLELCGDEKVEVFLKEKLDDKNFKLEKPAILEALKKGIPYPFNPLAQEVKKAVDIDFLWADFFVTGQKEPLLRIIDVVSRDDLFRKKLLEWMLAKHSKIEKKKSSDLLQQEVQIDMDFAKAKIDYPGDMDVMYSSYLTKTARPGQPSKKALEIRKILNLSDEEIEYMMIKAAAVWSLQMSVETHPLVREICLQAAKSRGPHTQFELNAIIK